MPNTTSSRSPRPSNRRRSAARGSTLHALKHSSLPRKGLHPEVPSEGGPRSTHEGWFSPFRTILRGRPGSAGPAPQDEGGGGDHPICSASHPIGCILSAAGISGAVWLSVMTISYPPESLSRHWP